MTPNDVKLEGMLSRVSDGTVVGYCEAASKLIRIPCFCNEQGRLPVSETQNVTALGSSVLHFMDGMNKVSCL